MQYAAYTRHKNAKTSSEAQYMFTLEAPALHGLECDPSRPPL